MYLIGRCNNTDIPIITRAYELFGFVGQRRNERFGVDHPGFPGILAARTGWNEPHVQGDIVLNIGLFLKIAGELVIQLSIGVRIGNRPPQQSTVNG